MSAAGVEERLRTTLTEVAGRVHAAGDPVPTLEKLARTRRSRRRWSAAVAVACLAVGAVLALQVVAADRTDRTSPTGPSISPSSSARPSGTALISPCRTAQLTVSLGRGGAAAGTSYQQVDFRNVSATLCTLYGYPSLVFLDKAGAAVGRPPQQVNEMMTPLVTVSLAPGQAGHASMGVETAVNFAPAACGPRATTTIRLGLPGERVRWTLPSAQVICSVGPASTLVTPFAPGEPATAVG